MATSSVVPVPTPYQPPSKGGNPYLKPGTTGAMVPASAVPVQSGTGGYTTFSSGQTYPAQSVSLSPQTPQVAGQSTSNQNPETTYVFDPSLGINVKLADLQRRGGGQSSGYTSPEGQYFNSEADYMKEVDNAYGGAYSALDEAQKLVESLQPGYLQDIEGLANVSKNKLDTSRSSALGLLDTSQTQGQRQKEDALTASRRLYNELSMANRQRFGGASSAGQAVSELQGVEKQRADALTQRNFTDFMNEINSKKQQVDKEYQSGLMEIEQTRQANINQANRDFQQKMLDIANKRADVGLNKAQARLQALQSLRNEIFTINQQATQFQQNIALMREQANLNLNNYTNSLAGTGATGANYLQSLLNNTTTNPTSNYAVAGGPNAVYQNNLTGVISTKKPEDLTGYVTGARQVVGYNQDGTPIYQYR